MTSKQCSRQKIMLSCWGLAVLLTGSEAESAHVDAHAGCGHAAWVKTQKIMVLLLEVYHYN
jgi:hypothetical protein